MGNSPGWAVEVKGSQIDIDDLREMLAQPFDPWVEDDLTGPQPGFILLRSKEWSALTDERQVDAQARRLLDQLNGAKLILDSESQKLETGAIVHFDDNGKRHTHIIITSAALMIGIGRLRARGFVTPAPDKVPEPSLLQTWLAAADRDDFKAELLVHLVRLDNWFDIYKAAELIRKLGGGDAALKGALQARDEWKEWDVVWKTANIHRHAPGTMAYAMPNPAAEIPSARKFLLRIAQRYF